VLSDGLLFSAFGLNVRLDCGAAILPPPVLDCFRLADCSRPDTADVDLVVHLLGASRRNGQKIELTHHVSADKAIRFHSFDTADGRSQRFASETSRGRVEFFFGEGAREMRVSWTEEAPADEVLSLLFNSMLAWAARISGRICLHASVVARDGHAIAFVAPSGSGKSTIAACLIERGYAGMSDDAAALTHDGERFCVNPGLPQLGLRHPSLEALPRFRAAPSIETDDKRRYALMASDPSHQLRFQNRVLPLATIYFLRRAASCDVPEVRPSKAPDAIAILMRNFYPASKRPTKIANAARQAADLSSLVKSVRCRHLLIPDDVAKLPSTADGIVEDITNQLAG